MVFLYVQSKKWRTETTQINGPARRVKYGPDPKANEVS
jgi:hypothetical protein